MTELPESIAIIGGGYIAAEYGHFFSSMGSSVTIIGRNPRFISDEEPEISALAKRVMSKYMTILRLHKKISGLLEMLTANIFSSMLQITNLLWFFIMRS